jgi:hypothetical protein
MVMQQALRERSLSGPTPSHLTILSRRYTLSVRRARKRWSADPACTAGAHWNPQRHQRSSGERRGLMPYPIVSRAPISHPQPERAGVSVALGTRCQTTDGSSPRTPVYRPLVQPADTPAQHPRRSPPRPVLLEAVVRRDGEARLSLALTLLARASRDGPTGLPRSLQEGAPA